MALTDCQPFNKAELKADQISVLKHDDAKKLLMDLKLVRKGKRRWTG
jgi:hypothetical protein